MIYFDNKTLVEAIVTSGQGLRRLGDAARVNAVTIRKAVSGKNVNIQGLDRLANALGLTVEIEFVPRYTIDE